MKNGALIFLAAFIALGGSWCGFVLAPQLQLGGAKQTTILNSSDVYPVGRPGEASLGLQAYRANGCAACHTKQVRQDGVACDVILVNAGKNRTGGAGRCPSRQSGAPGADRFPTNHPAHASAKPTRTRPPAKFPPRAARLKFPSSPPARTSARGWGLRGSVAEDFLYDNPVQPGSLRAGPDLADEASRLPDINWQLVHLYAPRSLIEGSMMPPYRYLFEVRKIGRKPSPDALILPPELALAGCEIVPKPEAKELAEYLLSLHVNTPLPDAPVTPPGGSYAPAGGESGRAGRRRDVCAGQGGVWLTLRFVPRQRRSWQTRPGAAAGRFGMGQRQRCPTPRADFAGRSQRQNSGRRQGLESFHGRRWARRCPTPTSPPC